jgi:hypothetical protein
LQRRKRLPQSSGSPELTVDTQQRLKSGMLTHGG